MEAKIKVRRRGEQSSSPNAGRSGSQGNWKIGEGEGLRENLT